MDARNLRPDAMERQFVEQEHREIARGIDRIGDVAERATSLHSVDLQSSLRELVAWLESSLEPHDAWEEAWLYPRLERLAGSPWLARLLRFEHDQIARAIARLASDGECLRREPTSERLAGLRAHLYGLDALIRAHLEREEHFLFPILDDPTPATPPVGGVVPV